MPQNQPSIAGTVTLLLQQIRRGEQDAIQPLFDVYFTRLAALGRSLLPDRFRRITDGEDLALEVLTAFFEAVGEGSLPELQSRADIWRMLARRIQQRAVNEIRNQSTQKAGEARVRGESVFLISPESPGQHGLQNLADRRMDDVLHELHRELIEQLDDPLLQEIASLLLAGHSVDEIAQQLGRSRATIYRKLEIIREAWLNIRSE